MARRAGRSQQPAANSTGCLYPRACRVRRGHGRRWCTQPYLREAINRCPEVTVHQVQLTAVRTCCISESCNEASSLRRTEIMWH